MSQQSHPYRTNRDLFSNHYLTEHLRQTEPWQEVDQDEVRDTYEEICDLWEDKKHRVEDYNESSLEDNFIRPMFDILDIPFEVEQTVERNARRPDYGFFPSEEAADAAYDRDDFYEEAIAVADAKYWGRKLDTRGEKKRDYENPSYQIHDYLMETPPQWGVLTNGKQWRLYYGPTSHRLDSYYEIDLPEILQYVEEGGGIEDFKDFYLFFRQRAFLPDQSGDCFLDDVYDESSVFAEAIGEDLQENIYEAIRVLAEGFLDTNDDLVHDDLPLVHDSSLIYLYRLIFVLYAESEGRDLLPTDNDIYSESYSLNELKQTVVDNRDDTQQHYQTWQTNLWDRLEELFVLIDQGSQGKGIPKDQLYIPAYNGGLFRTDPDPDDSEEARFLATHEADDAHLAEVIDLLTRRDADEGDGQVFVDYSSLDERHLGSIYEGLLEYKLDVADEPLTVEDGEYSPAVDDEVDVAEGDVYLRTDAGERKATGSYYTPEYVVEYIVDETLVPLVGEIREGLVGTESYHEGGFAGMFADRVFDLKVLDPAMGSGHFLVNAVDYLAREIIDAQERQDQQAVKRGDEEAISDPRTEEGELRDINWARRKVAQRCIYGVDLNPLATELAKVSLWLRTLAAEQPLAFLDHHLKTGNSLVGSDIKDVLSNGDDSGQSGQTRLSDWMDQARQRAIEHVMERFTELLSIDNETLEDIKAMEEVYEEVREDPLYQHLLAMANVHTASEFGLNVPEDAEEQMAEALRDDTWEDVEGKDWFQSAQAMADEERFFHWELEFPVAFYSENGKRLADDGFDAVISNPPYIRIQNLRREQPAVADYLIQSHRFSTTEARFDIYAPFVELGTDLARKNQLSYILPNKFFKSDGGEGLREYLSDLGCISEIVDFGNYQVFSGATTYTCILSLRHGSSGFDYVPAYDGVEDPKEIGRLSRVSIQNEEIGSGPWVLTGPREKRVLEKMGQSNLTVGDIAEYVSQGLVTGDNNVLFVELFNVGEEYTTVRSSVNEETYRLETEMVHPVIDGDDVSRYDPPVTGIGVIYPYQSLNGDLEVIPENSLRDQYPETYDYLNDFRNRLASRGSASMNYQTWYALWRPREKRLWDQPKLLHPRIVAQSEFTLDNEGGLYLHDSGYAIVPKDNTQKLRHYLLAVLNSSAAWFFLYMTSPVIENDFRQPLANYLTPIPLPEITPDFERDQFDKSPDSYIEPYVRSEEDLGQENKNELLAHLAHDLLNYHDRYSSLNLAILDYLGNYNKGPKLPDTGLFQPTSQNILNATWVDHEKLQVERVRTTRDVDSVTIEATARYKPEDKDEFETDTWGYTETEYLEAFTLADLTDEEAALIEAFVPVAVEEEIGGFRDNATKTKSLIDRLKDITLPDIDDVQDDLQRYIETKEREEELNKQIEKADHLIDDIVYDLYGLAEEEVEIVEKTVNENN